jgi:hypothetical protein
MDSVDHPEFRSIRNPYIVGNPITDPEMFYGRSSDFEYLRGRFSDTGSGVLHVFCGARRSGKTSLLMQIADGRLGIPLHTVMIDMQSVAVKSDREFFERLSKDIASSPEGSEAIRNAPPWKGADRPIDEFGHLIEGVTRSLGKKRLLLMFDEYELLESLIRRGSITDGWLRGLDILVEGCGLLVLFAGSKPLASRDQLLWLPLTGRATHRRLAHLAKPDALRLITEPVAHQVTYEHGAPERIFELTAGHPFYTQVFCQALVDHLNDEKRGRISLDDVEAVTERITDSAPPQMVLSWMELSDLEKLALAATAEESKDRGGPITADEILSRLRRERAGRRTSASNVSLALSSLSRQEFLIEYAWGKGYAFEMDLWKLWILRCHGMGQVAEEVAAGRNGTVDAPTHVFISAKSADYDYALRVYEFLTDRGIAAFFSKESLPQLGESDYRKAIDQALDETKHMIVVTSSSDNVRSSWVEAEWGFFINEKRSDRKSGNLITLTVGDVGPADLPPSLRSHAVIPYGEKHLPHLLDYVSR